LLTFYVDEQIAPGGTLNREAYGLLTPANGKYTVKAGKFFLPYGLRLGRRSRERFGQADERDCELRQSALADRRKL
jgi:hypothetical protein